MKRKNKKLTRLIVAALMCVGGELASISFVEAAPIDTVDASDEGDGTKNVFGNNDGADITTNSGAPSNNTLTVNGGTFASVTGAGDVGAVSASGNVVNINGGTINGNVVGGSSAGGDAKNNIVNIYAVNDITGGVYGAQAYVGTSSDNIINILGTISISGFLDADGLETLNIASKSNKASVIYGQIKNINFFFPADTKPGDIMLTLTGVDPWGMEVQTDLTKTTIGAAAQKGFSLSKGDVVTLIKNPKGVTAPLGTADAKTVIASAPTGITTSEDYEFEISKSGEDSIIATVTGTTENNESSESAQELAKSPVETRAATTTFVNAGADMLASQGFAQAANAVALDTAAQAQSGAAGAPAASAFTPFAAFGGQSMRAQSGSYVDTKGFGLNIGFAREIANSQGKLLFGPVVEYGGGTYASHLEDAAGTRGDGKAHYFGVGVMARQVNHDGFYYEGSVRGGRVTSDYRSFINNQTVDYDSSSNYWAAHVGVGKAFSVGGSNTLDGYLKYFYSHQAGDDVTMHGSTTGDEAWSFDSVDSHRIRIGARLTHKVNERNSFYGGLAYQYEFGGEARAHYNGTATPSPSVKGSSGMLELGWQVKPGGPVTIDLGVTGWAGKQRGGSVQLGATWTF